MESTDKFERIAEIEGDPRLRRHRFLLSENPVLREKLSLLQKEAVALEKEFPEIIAVQLLGSHTKGYAEEASDYDLALPLELEQLAVTGRTAEEVVSQVRTRIANALGVEKPRITVQYYENAGGSTHPRPRYELFLLSLGHKMRAYREAVIAELETKADGEAQWKDMMVALADRENLYFSQALTKERKSLYPMTLAEGRKYFLPVPKDEPTPDS